MTIIKNKIILAVSLALSLNCNSIAFADTESRNNFCLAPASFLKYATDLAMRKEYLSLYNDKAPNKYYHKHHVARVTDFMQILTEKANLPQNERDTLYKAALLHDFGSVNEDFDITKKVTSFVNNTFTDQKEIDALAWYHRRGIFGEEDYQAQINKTINLLESKNIYKETGIAPTVLRYQIQQRNEFTPINSIKEAEKRNISLSNLEKTLIMYHHTEPKYITLANIQKSFPALSAEEIKDLHSNTHRLLPFLIACDTLEASSNVERNRIQGIKTDKTFELLYFYLNSRLAKNEINDTLYNLITSLLKTNDTDLLNVIKESRQLKELPKEDLLFLKDNKYNTSKVEFFLNNLQAKNIQDIKKLLKETTVNIDGTTYRPDYIEFNDELFVIIETPKKAYIFNLQDTEKGIAVNVSSRINMLKNFFDTDRLMQHCANLIKNDLQNLLTKNSMLKSLKSTILPKTDPKFNIYKNKLKGKTVLVESIPESPNLKTFIIETSKDKIEIIDIDIKEDQISNFNKRITKLSGDLDKAAKFSTITDQDASRNILYPEFSLFDLDKASDDINPFVKINDMRNYVQIDKKTDLSIFNSLYKFWKYTFAHISDQRIVKEILDTDYYLLNLQSLMDEAYSATYLSSCSYKKVGSSIMLRNGDKFMVVFGANGLQTDVYDDKTFTEAEARHSIATALNKLNIINDQMNTEEIESYVNKVVFRITKKPGLPDFSCKSLSENISEAFAIKNYKYCRRDKITNEQKIPRDKCPSLCAERSGIRRYGAAKYISEKTGQNIALVKLIKFPNNLFSAMYYSYETKELNNLFFTQKDIDNVINKGENKYDDMLVVGNLNPCYHCMTAFKDTLKQQYPSAKFNPQAVTVIASELNMHKRDLAQTGEEYIDAEDILSLNIGIEGKVKILNMPRYNINQTNHLLKALNAEKYGPEKMHLLFDQNYLLANSVNSSLFSLLTQEVIKDKIDDVREIIKVLKKHITITEDAYFLNNLPLNSMKFVDDMLLLINEPYRIVAPGVKYTAKEALNKIKTSNAILGTYILEKLNNPQRKQVTYTPTRVLDQIHKHQVFSAQAA